jgi:nitrogen fixation/metabolism regulation signal transduction histidine kinase
MTLTQVALLLAIAAIIYLKQSLSTAETVADMLVDATLEVAKGNLTISVSPDGDISFNKVKG